MRVALLLCLTLAAVLVGHTEAFYFPVVKITNVVHEFLKWGQKHCRVQTDPPGAGCYGRRRRDAEPRVQIPPFGGLGGRFGVGTGDVPSVDHPELTEEGPEFPCSSLSLTGVSNMPKLVLEEAFRAADRDEDGELTFVEFQVYDLIIDTIEECLEKKEGIIPSQ